MYDCDVRQVERLLLEVARGNEDVLASLAPQVRLVKFGDVGVVFELLVWTIWANLQLHGEGWLTGDRKFRHSCHG